MMKCSKKSMLVATLVMLSTISVKAQKTIDSLPDYSSETDKLEKIEKIEKIISHLPKISGFLQLGYNLDIGENIADDHTDINNTFLIRRARFKMDGDITSKIDYCMQIEFVNPKILDLYMRFKPFRQLNVQAGQFKTPFSIENTYYLPKNTELIDAPMAIGKLVQTYDGIGTTGRNLGVNIYGGFFKKDGFCILNYDLGIYNGNGINLKDIDWFKTIVARINVQPLKDLRISASYLYGGNTELEWQDTNGITHTEEYLYHRYAIGLSYDKPEGLIVRSEWVGGSTNGIDAQGLYLTLGWHINKKWTCVARCDYYQSNMDIKETRLTNFSVGMVWQPIKYIRLQVNYYNQENYNFSKNSNHFSVLLTGIF